MSNSILTRRFAALFSVLALVGLNSAVRAETSNTAAHDDGEVNRIEVRFGDLDLQSEAGAETLLNRLAIAARNACGGRPSMLDPVQFTEHAIVEFETCKRTAIRKAVRAVNHPIVTAVFESKLAAIGRPASR